MVPILASLFSLWTYELNSQRGDSLRIRGCFWRKSFLCGVFCCFAGFHYKKCILKAIHDIYNKTSSMVSQQRNCSLQPICRASNYISTFEGICLPYSCFSATLAEIPDFHNSADYYWYFLLRRHRWIFGRSECYDYEPYLQIFDLGL